MCVVVRNFCELVTFASTKYQASTQYVAVGVDSVPPRHELDNVWGTLARLSKGLFNAMHIYVFVHCLGVILSSQVGSHDSGVELTPCYQKVAGCIPLVCMLSCPWARYRTSNFS